MRTIKSLHLGGRYAPHKQLIAVACLCLMPALVSLSGCDRTTKELPPASSTVADDTQVVEAQTDHARHEVTIQATVAKLLSDDTKGIPHERFLVNLSNGSTVLIVHNTNQAIRVPVHEGDSIRVQGEYIWNDKGGLIHWTHHSDSPRHEGGWIEYAGKRYQ